MYTLTLTDVHSSWTETRALLNKAHRWVKEAIEDVKEKLPFQMKGIDSDNGSEFKNTQLLQWCVMRLSSLGADHIKRMIIVLLNRKMTVW
ncbi:hypothetical protein [Treponema vincentii]|uniref:hypothetical protein n=1 Tax=Treponema vincentii TaxID=69710 RepID=UPI00313BD729